MLSWVAVDAVTGGLIADLPDFQPSGPVGVTLGAYTQAQGSLPLPKSVIDWANTKSGDAPLESLADWRAATRPGSAVLVALDERNEPIWGGLVLQRTTDHTASAQLASVTVEAYLARRFVGNKTYAATDQNSIFTDLIDSFITDGTLPGLPIDVVVVGGAGAVRDRTYEDADDKTVYDVLSELMGVDGGPEWTVGWQWKSSPQRITPVLYVGTRIGSAPPAGLQPNALFSMPGCVSSAQYVEDYSSGKGANAVTASSGQGADGGRLSSTATGATLGRPTFEYRWTPSTSITDTTTLEAHAAQVLAQAGDGSAVLSLTARRDKAPVLGVDWNLGDDIAYDLTAPAWIDGLEGTGRAYGWQRDDFNVTPILVTGSAA